MKPRCTTCGAMEYRRALRAVAGRAERRVFDLLREIDPNELVRQPDWDDAVETALYEVDFPPGREELVQAWQPKIGESLRFDDAVTFRIVRWLPATSDTRRDWLRAVVPFAVNSRDFSLTETLVLVMGPTVSAYPALVDVAVDIAGKWPQMRRVLRNASGI